MAIDINQWKQEEIRINNEISRYIFQRRWKCPAVGEKNIDGFYNHIIFVICKFLEEQDSRELRIKIPVEELSDNNKSDQQAKRFSILCKVVAHCLNMATANALRVSIEGDVNNFLANNSEYCGYCGYCKTTRGGMTRSEWCFFQIDNGKLRGWYLPSRGQNNCIPRPVAILKECTELIRVSKMTLPQRGESLDWGGTRLVSSTNEILDGLPSLDVQYSSASLITQGFVPGTRVMLGTVDTERNHFDGKEIIVIIGDKYLHLAQRFRNAIGNKKIIYISTECPNVSGGVEMQYEFSHREMNYYCNGSAYQNIPETIMLDFPWKDNRMRELYDILDRDQAIPLDEKQKICRKIARWFSNGNFDEDQLSRLRNYLQDNIGEWFLDSLAAQDTIGAIIRWFNALAFSGDNPKQEWIKKHHPKLTIMRDEKYVRRLNSLSGQNGANQIIAVDALSDYSCGNKVYYSGIMQYYPSAKIHSLYYNNDQGEYELKKSLLYSVNEEQKVYRSEGRCRFGTNLNISDELDNSLVPDYSIINEYDDYSMGRQGNTVRQSRVVTIITETDDVCTDNIDGKAILIKEDESFSIIDVEEINDGDEIVYYTNPDEFEIIINHYYNYGNNRTVADFSNLWQSRFQQAYSEYRNKNQTEQEAIESMSNDSGIDTNTIRSYKNGSNRKFSNRMTTICGFLVRKQLLTTDEAALINAAWKRNNKNRPLGTRLKENLLNYYIGYGDTSMLEKINRNSNGEYTTERIMKLSLKRGIVKSIVTQ